MKLNEMRIDNEETIFNFINKKKLLSKNLNNIVRSQ